MSQKPSYTIAISGLNAIDSPGPGVAVIRALREAKNFNVRIVGLSYEALEPGIYMEGICDMVYQIPYPSAGSEALKIRLDYIHAREELDMVIPNFDAELINFIKIEKQLNFSGIKTFLPTLNQFEAIDKLHFYDFATKHNLPVPRTKAIYSVDEITTITTEYSYPYVVKGKYYEAYVAYTAEQAHKYFHKLNAKWGLPIIIQEFVSGTEVNVAGLGDGEGGLVGAVAMRKLYITDKGKAWSGVTIQDDSLIELTKKFCEFSKWKSGFEIEIMKTPTGILYIMEINPRFPAWIYLTAGVGQNLPVAAVELAMGKSIEYFDAYDVGKMFIRHALDQIVNVSDFQQLSTTGEFNPKK